MNTLHKVFFAALAVACASLLSGCRSGNPAPAVDGATLPKLTATRVIGGLQEPVSLVFLEKNIWLVAERRAGRIRWIQDGKLRATPFATVPVPTAASGYNEYGLLGLAVDPDYPDSPYVYAFHTMADGSGKPTGQRIVRFTVKKETGVDMRTIVDGLPFGSTCCHNGGRIIFGSDGKLYATLGDTQRPDQAQDYEALPGKILRYNPDGTIPADNPFEKALTGWAGDKGHTDDNKNLDGQQIPVFTIGHRNPFGIAVNPADSEIYITENGPDHDDEINHLTAGDNYGWPVVMGKSDDPHFHNPLWASGKTTIAPTGCAFYIGEAIPALRGNLLFANYNDGQLRRAVFSGPDSITSVEVIKDAGKNAKLDVAMGLDGNLYFTSMNAIYRLDVASK